MADPQLKIQAAKRPALRWSDTERRLRAWALNEDVELSDRALRKLAQLVIRLQREARRG